MHGLNHDVRETHRKLTGRLALVNSLVYRRTAPLAPFSLKVFDHIVDPPEAEQTLGEGGWTPVPPYTYWGRSFVNFALVGEFTVPPDFGRDGPLALYLPLGDAGAFSHPEVTVTIDGEIVATADRHHQELALPRHFADGAHAPDPADRLDRAARGARERPAGPADDAPLPGGRDRPGRPAKFVAAARTALDAARVP